MVWILFQILFGEEPEFIIPALRLSGSLPKLFRADSYLVFGGVFHFLAFKFQAQTPPDAARLIRNSSV
jgi:hypothetical protein